MKATTLSAKVSQMLADLSAAADHKSRAKLIAELEERGIKPSIIQKQGKIADYELRHYRRVNKKLLPEVADLFYNGKLSFSHAKVLAGTSEKQESLARDAIAKQLSVHTLRLKIAGTHSTKFLRDIERMANEYSELSGLDIQITPDPKNTKAGRWVISYYDLDMFEQIREKLLGKVTGDF